jgi:hypothetical protein
MISEQRASSIPMRSSCDNFNSEATVIRPLGAANENAAAKDECFFKQACKKQNQLEYCL